jgi:hypothetical protein
MSASQNLRRSWALLLRLGLLQILEVFAVQARIMAQSSDIYQNPI